MSEYNADIKKAIKRARIKQYEVARKIGRHPSTFCSMLAIDELPQEKKDKIFKAIEEIKSELEEE